MYKCSNSLRNIMKGIYYIKRYNFANELNFFFFKNVITEVWPHVNVHLFYLYFFVNAKRVYSQLTLIQICIWNIETIKVN